MNVSLQLGEDLDSTEYLDSAEGSKKIEAGILWWSLDSWALVGVTTEQIWIFDFIIFFQT